MFIYFCVHRNIERTWAILINNSLVRRPISRQPTSCSWWTWTKQNSWVSHSSTLNSYSTYKFKFVDINSLQAHYPFFDFITGSFLSHNDTVYHFISFPFFFFSFLFSTLSINPFLSPLFVWLIPNLLQSIGRYKINSCNTHRISFSCFFFKLIHFVTTILLSSPFVCVVSKTNFIIFVYCSVLCYYYLYNILVINVNIYCHFEVWFGYFKPYVSVWVCVDPPLLMKVFSILICI